MNTDEHDHPEPLLDDIEETASIDGLSIFWHDPMAPAGFDAGTLTLDATLASDLHWRHAESIIKQMQQTGKKCLINLELGLFNNLKLPLSNKAQFLSLSVAINHFVEKIYSPFKKEIIAVMLFHGDLFASSKKEADHYAQWLAEQTSHSPNCLLYFLLESRFEFLHLLSNSFPRALALIVMMEEIPASSYTLLSTAFLLAKKNNIIISCSRAPFAFDPSVYIGSEANISSATVQPSFAICFNTHQAMSLEKELDGAIAALLKRHIPFRLISEEAITTECAGIDRLLVASTTIDTMTKRKLQGFKAAMGEIIYLEHPTRIEGECSFDEQIHLL